MFDEKKASTAVRFIKLLKHTQGEFARKPFNLMPFQEKIVKELIGTLNKDGTRQYREAFIFLPRKNGKTELIAAMLVYFLFMDDEYEQKFIPVPTTENRHQRYSVQQPQ